MDRMEQVYGSLANTELMRMEFDHIDKRFEELKEVLGELEEDFGSLKKDVTSLKSKG